MIGVKILENTNFFFFLPNSHPEKSRAFWETRLQLNKPHCNQVSASGCAHRVVSARGVACRSRLHHCHWTVDSAVFTRHSNGTPVAPSSIYLYRPEPRHAGLMKWVRERRREHRPTKGFVCV